MSAIRRMWQFAGIEKHSILATLLSGFAGCRQRLSGRARRRFETRVSGESLERRILLFTLNSRWTTTATNGSGLSQGDATTVTWSIVPDGTMIGAFSGLPSEVATPSNLVAFLNGIYGTVSGNTELHG